MKTPIVRVKVYAGTWEVYEFKTDKNAMLFCKKLKRVGMEYDRGYFLGPSRRARKPHKAKSRAVKGGAMKTPVVIVKIGPRDHEVFSFKTDRSATLFCVDIEHLGYKYNRGYVMTPKKRAKKAKKRSRVA